MKFHWSGHIRDFLLTLFKKKSSFIFYYKGLSLKRCMSVSSFCLKSSVRFLVVARNQTPALTSKALSSPLQSRFIPRLTNSDESYIHEGADSSTLCGTGPY